MSCSNESGSFFAKLAESKRERKLQRRQREHGASERAKQREGRLSRRRIRDRARWAAQRVEGRETLLQSRRERLDAESAEQREARLHQITRGKMSPDTCPYCIRILHAYGSYTVRLSTKFTDSHYTVLGTKKYDLWTGPV